MAFHTLNINNNLFELAPFKVKAPVAEADANYFIPFLSGNPGTFIHATQDVNPSNIYIAGNVLKGVGGKFYYNPSSNILTVGNVKITGTNSSTATIKADAATNMYVDIGGNIPLVIKYDSTDKFIACGSSFSNLVNLGTSARKWANVYATTFHGSLDGDASFSNKVLITSQTASNDFPIIFGASDSVTSTGPKSVHADAHLNYNPSTNVLTVPTVSGNLSGTATNATNITIAPANKTDASYYIQFVNGPLGNRKSYVDTALYYNPKNNALTVGQVNGKLNGPVQTTSTGTNASYFISFVNDSNTGMRYSYVNSGLYYNPSTNELSAGGGFYERSDERLKDFQEDIEVNFSYLHNIPKKYYSWKDDATYTRHIGTSAQAVQKYYPELVNTDDNGYLTMNYDKLSVVALKAIDVLHEEVTELKKENAELKERLARLEELILNK